MFKVELPTSKKVGFVCISESSLKIMVIAFRSLLKTLFLNYCLDNFSHVGKSLDQKAKVNFKILSIMYWETNNCNTHIAHYLTK